jgi:hypothetical protein
MRRHLTTLLTTILPAAIIVWIIITIFLTNPWAPAVSDEAFDRITDGMSIADVERILGDPLAPIYHHEDSRPLPAVLGVNSSWIIERTLIVAKDWPNPIERREWIGKKWGISIEWDRHGKQTSRVLWRVALN